MGSILQLSFTINVTYIIAAIRTEIIYNNTNAATLNDLGIINTHIEEISPGVYQIGKKYLSNVYSDKITGICGTHSIRSITSFVQAFVK